MTTDKSKATFILVLLALSGGLVRSQSVPEVIHYQGKLMDGSNLFNGVVDMVFRLHENPVGGSHPLCESTHSVAVVDGYYTAAIGDNITFGSLDNALLHGGEVWLEVEIDGQVIEPRERLVAVPYARLAAAMPANSVDMAMIRDNAVQFWHIAPGAVRSSHIQSSAVGSAQLAALAVTEAKLAAGAVTSGKIAPGSILLSHVGPNGAAAGQVLQWNGAAWVVATPARLLSYAENGTFATAPLAGGDQAIAQGFGAEAESSYSVVGGGQNNTVTTGASHATVSGGRNNQASGPHATVAGGWANRAQADGATVGGGYDNTATHFGVTIAGGYQNLAEATDATIGGGNWNTAQGEVSAVGGGERNVASGKASTVPGGAYNGAAADYAFAAGRRAKANHQGAFVWGDSTDADIASTAANQVSFRCNGGVRFTSGAGGGNQTVSWAPGSGSWTFASDRGLKEDLAPVDAREVLERVAALPITEWNYRGYGQRHIGPMAQDFHAAFPLAGSSDTAINSLHLDGVALAAIQGLYRENQELKARLERLEALLADR